MCAWVRLHRNTAGKFEGRPRLCRPLITSYCFVLSGPLNAAPSRSRKMRLCKCGSYVRKCTRKSQNFPTKIPDQVKGFLISNSFYESAGSMLLSFLQSFSFVGLLHFNSSTFYLCRLLLNFQVLHSIFVPLRIKHFEKETILTLKKKYQLLSRLIACRRCFSEADYNLV